jgi:hypothetical protein
MSVLLKQARRYSGVSYNNLFFWLNQRHGSNIFDLGVKKHLISERGHIDNLDIFNINSNLILGKEFKVGKFNIENNEYHIINPIEYSNLIRTYKIDLNKINTDPENIDNKIATFELKNDILRETYFKYFN